jgi:hypothetical protein
MRRHREDRVTPLMPPRKRNWCPGTYQIGVFIRTAEGSVIEMVRDAATEGEALAVQNAWLEGAQKKAKPCLSGCHH